MKHLLIILVLLALSVPVFSDTQIVTEAQYVIASGGLTDTLGREPIVPDSIRIIVTDSAMTELFDAWFNNADAQCVLSGSLITFSDQWEDINGAADIGNFNLAVTIASDNDNGIDLFSLQSHVIIGVTNTLEASLAAAITALTYPDSTILSNILHRILWGTAVGSGSDSSTAAQRDIGVIASRAIGLAQFDTAAAAAFYSFTIWLDDGAANTDSDVGVDGTLANPVSTLAAARILADSMDIHQYNILNASSFTLAATHEDWIFLDVGSGSTVDIGSQDVDGSTFRGLIITGIQGGTGTINLINCQITDLHDFDGNAEFCWLVDSLVMDNNSSAFFGNCYSSVAGNGTPKIDFHVASNNVAFRNYSGGINIFRMSSNDKLSIEGNGQIIVDATCSSAPITARGNFTITDNGSSTVWTDDAVFNVTQNIGINYADIDNPTAVVNFTQTTVDSTREVGTVGGNVDGSVGSVTGKVTVVDSSAGDISYTANNQGDYKADVSALALEASLFDPAADIVTPADTTGTNENVGSSDFDYASNDVGIDGGSVDDIWNEDSTGHWTSPNMAFVSGQTGAGAGGADSTEAYGAAKQALIDQPAVPMDTTSAGDSTGVMPGGFTAADSAGFQGSASGLSAAEVADTLGNRGVTTGNGQYYDSLIVLNTIDSTAIASMGFDVLPLDGGTALARVTTDLNGISVARLEAGSLSVRLIFQGYTFNTKDTLVIAGSQTDTLWGTGVVLPAPPADMVTIVMGLITANFDTLNPTYVYWRPVKSTGKAYKKSDELYYGTGVNALAIQKDWTIETSATSTFSFSVFANANLSDATSKYEFWFYWADGRITQKITAVPDQASFNPIGQ